MVPHRGELYPSVGSNRCSSELWPNLATLRSDQGYDCTRAFIVLLTTTGSQGALSIIVFGLFGEPLPGLVETIRARILK